MRKQTEKQKHSLSSFIRTYRKTTVRSLWVNDIEGEGYLTAIINGTAMYYIHFASSEVLWNWLHRKHLLQGVPLYWNGVTFDVSYSRIGRKPE